MRSIRVSIAQNYLLRNRSDRDTMPPSFNFQALPPPSVNRHMCVAMKKPAYQIVTGDYSYDTWALLRQTSAMLDACMERGCQKAGLSVSAYILLHAVKHGPNPMTAYKLSHILNIRHNSCAQIVRRLVARGLLSRCVLDGKLSLDITEAGVQLLETVSSSNSIERVVKSLPAVQLQRVQNALLPLRDACMRELAMKDVGKMELSPPVSMETGQGIGSSLPWLSSDAFPSSPSQRRQSDIGP